MGSSFIHIFFHIFSEPSETIAGVERERDSFYLLKKFLFIFFHPVFILPEYIPISGFFCFIKPTALRLGASFTLQHLTILNFRF